MATQSNTHAKISLTGLRKSFGAKQVLRDLDLDIQEGRSLVIIGASGSGKSVLLKCILGLIAPDAGAIEIDGARVSPGAGNAGDGPVRQIGMLFQGAALFDSLKVWE
ncbi:MAG: ATP-binding cassette domain-containing protein, partial [Pseudomonadota bacterium]